MAEQGALLRFMIENEVEKQDAKILSISNFQFLNPKEIKLEADEIAFVSLIKVHATADFSLKYNSVSESREIKKTIAILTLVESNIVTKHLSTIKFEMSNSDEYEVSMVIIKMVK